MSAKTSYPRLSLPARLPLRAAILAALSAAPVVCAATVPPNSAIDASEFQVDNIVGIHLNDEPKVARDAIGDFVVVWQNSNQLCVATTCYVAVYAQRYSAAGQPEGNAFRVSTHTDNFDSADPHVAMDAAGDFVVTWAGYRLGTSGTYDDIYARQYNAAGTALQASEFLVDTLTTGYQRASTVAMDAAGDFVVAWEHAVNNSGQIYGDIYARQYTSAGTAVQATEFLVNTYTTGPQSYPSVAMDAAGDFVVAWVSYDQVASNSSGDIYVRQYHANGTAVQTSEFFVNTATTDQQTKPAVAMDVAGDFVVAWMSYDQAASNSNYDVYARQFTSAGSAVQTSEFLVNTVTTVDQKFPAVAVDAGGDFVVTWAGYRLGTSGTYGDIYARQYNAAGTALQTSEFLVNTLTSGSQGDSATAMDAAGDFVVTWDRNSAIYARRYEGPESVDLAVTLAAGAASVTAGGDFDITLGVDNTTAPGSFGNAVLDSGSGAASGISAVFTLPAGVNTSTVSGTGWSCGTRSGTSLTCNYSGALAAATAGPDLTVAFTADAVGSLPLQVAVSSYQQDSNSSNNTANTSVSSKDVAPTATAGSLSTTAGTAVSGTLMATAGYSGQLLSFAIASQPGHGTVTLNDARKGTFTYTPVSGFAGSDSFTFTVGDGTLSSGAAKETLIVTASGSGGGSSSGGGGAFGLFSLTLLGLPLRRRMRRAASRH